MVVQLVALTASPLADDLVVESVVEMVVEMVVTRVDWSVVEMDALLVGRKVGLRVYRRVVVMVDV